MAIDWIKMRVDLQSHPKVVRILSAMRPHDVHNKTDKFRVIGGLHAVWSVFDAHCEDGILNGYTPETLDHVIGWNGFSSAMVSVGWLIENVGVSLAIPEFSEHNGQSAKRRAEDQKRKRDSRNSPEPVRNLSANDADEKQTRKEKIRKEVNTYSAHVQSVIGLYHAALPELPAVRIIPAKRKAAIAKFIDFVLTSKKTDGTPRATTEAEALEWINAYFHRVRDNNFLMGKIGRVGEHSGWQCDLDYLLTDKGMTQVIEKTREAA